MRVLLDENIDQALESRIPDHDLIHVVKAGWKGTKNGALLAKIAEVGLDAFVTADKNMPYQQSMKGRPFMLIVLDIHPNTIDTQTACIPRIRHALESGRPGQVYVVEGPHSKRGR